MYVGLISESMYILFEIVRHKNRDLLYDYCVISF